MLTLKQKLNYFKNQVKSRIQYAVNPQLIYGKPCFYDDTREGKLASITQAAEVIWEKFKPSTVVDIGCGEGMFLDPLHQKGAEVLGCDISEAAIALAPKQLMVFQADATKPLRFNRKFDLCICVEIAEHIPTRCSETLVDNVTRASDTVFFTAALPWQGGVGHINEQPHEFWINLFEKQGFALDKHLTETIRQELEDRQVVFWLYKNVLIFKKTHPLI